MFVLVLIFVIALWVYAGRHVAVSERKPHHYFLVLCMVLGWLWTGFALLQLQPSHPGGPREVAAVPTAEESCAKYHPNQPAEKCDPVFYDIYKMVGATRFKAGQYTTSETLQIVFGPPLGLLVLGLVVTWIASGFRRHPSN